MSDGKQALLEALREAGLEDMAKAAEAGAYSDFASPFTFPMIQLVRELEAAGHDDLARRAKEGEFDHDR